MPPGQAPTRPAGLPMSSRNLIGRGRRLAFAHEGEEAPGRETTAVPATSPTPGPRRDGEARRPVTVLALVLAGLVPLLVAGLIAASLGSSAIVDAANARAIGASREAAQSVDAVISTRVASLRAAADDIAILAAAETHADPAQAAAASADLRRLIAQPGTIGVTLSDVDGIPLLAQGSGTGAVPADWRAQLALGGSVASMVAPSTPAAAMSVAVPILRGGGTAGGYLVEEFDLDGLPGTLQRVAAAQDAELRLLDARGHLLLAASGSGGTAPAAKPPLTTTIAAALRSHASIVDDSGGIPMGVTPLRGAAWVAVSLLPASALAPIGGLDLSLALACAVLALLFLTAVWLVDRVMRRHEQAEADLRQQTAVLEQAAMHDPLTGLPNRLLLNDRLQHGISNAQRTGRKMAIFVLDVDDFKALNDSLGHAAGDAILRETAVRLQSAVRAADTVARFGAGSDEFAIVAVDADRGDAELIQAKIRQRMEEPIRVEDGEVSVRLSMGLAVFPDESAEAAQLLRLADIDMYRDKRSRKLPGRSEAVTHNAGETAERGV
jgi:diguanylate cyclase (GGDEF)-like protein